MRFEEFNAGNYIPQYQYQSFLPTKINLEWSWNDPRMNVLLEKATKSLGELNAFTQIVPDVDLFIQMHVVNEASFSSRIEGTKTHIEEAVLEESEILPERRNDWHEVQNYIHAMNDAIDRLGEFPLSLRLIRDTQKTLMQ